MSVCRIAMASIVCVHLSVGVQAQVPNVDRYDAVAKVRVFTKATKESKPIGSGIVLTPHGHILTAKHVIQLVNKETQVLKVQFIDNATPEYEAEFFECAPGNTDICLIKVNDSAIRAAGLKVFSSPSCRMLDADEAVTLVGWPGHEQMGLDRVSGRITGQPVSFLYPSSFVSIGGMSGGPIYDSSNRIVALMKGALPGNERAFISPILYARNLVEVSGLDCSPVPRVAKVAAASPSEAVGSRLELTSETNFADLPQRFRTLSVPGADETSRLSRLTEIGTLSLAADLILAPGSPPRRLSAHTLELLSGADIVTNGVDLTIEVVNLVVDGGVLRSFNPDSAGAQPGQSAGRVQIYIYGSLVGELVVQLNGTKGKDGAAGTPGGKGPRGAAGRPAASSAFDCSRGPQNGFPGGPGLPGGQGGNGGNGGAGGMLKVFSADPVATRESMIVSVLGGAKGAPGPGGPGGPGGDGGPPGGVSGWCKQTANSGPAGPRGQGGVAGLEGEPGASGNAQFELLVVK